MISGLCHIICELLPTDCHYRHLNMLHNLENVIHIGGLVFDNVFHKQRERHRIRPESSPRAGNMCYCCASGISNICICR